MRFETRCVHTGVYKDDSYNSATTPIYPASTFTYDDIGVNRGYDYTRSGNPTRRALEENIASLEGGTDCRCMSSGMAAITTAMQLFKPGDHVISGDDLYGGTFRLFHNVLSEQGFEFSFVDMTDLDAVRAAVRPETRCVWIETPSNPLMKIIDLAAVAEIARDAGAISIADNTFMSPYFQRPFEHGIDIVVHSMTKYLNGHSDAVGGCVVTQDDEHAERIDYLHNALGTGCSPFDAWLILRGIKTLGPRMEAHQRGAMALAEMLVEHPAVKRIYYAGLSTHPGHELAKRQMSGFGGMLTVDLNGGREAARRLCTKTKLFLMAVSLGGTESLIDYPEGMSHASMTAEARAAAGISESTVRLSVGIEHPDDLIDDVRQALAD